MFAFILMGVIVQSIHTECWHYRFDYKYELSTDGWFKLYRVPADWHRAHLRCHLEGAVLASPINEQLLSLMTKKMFDEKLSSLHTGIHATFSKGDYASVEGVPLSRIAVTWAPGEPDDQDNDEDCLILQLAGNMADVNCSKILPYMCYKQKTKPVATSECGTIDSEYKWSNITGSCYKYHHEGQTWQQAYMTCAAEGGHLAIINSDAEAEVLKQLASRPDQTATKGHNVYLGYQDIRKFGVWMTIHGQSLKEAGYEKWGPGQPGNQGDKQNCGALTKTGLLDDIFCSALCSFICEKSPGSLEADIQEATKKR